MASEILFKLKLYYAYTPTLAGIASARRLLSLRIPVRHDLSGRLSYAQETLQDMASSDQKKDSILPMGQSFGNNLRHVNRLIQRDLGIRIASLNISIGQWYAL